MWIGVFASRTNMNSPSKTKQEGAAAVYYSSCVITMAEKGTCHLPLAFIPDGALAIVFSFVAVNDLLSANKVCRDWVLDGTRVDLWASLGKIFEVAMPVSLGPQTSQRAAGSTGATAGGGRGKRVLRSGANAKRTFLKSYAAAVKSDRLKHDSTLSEAYTLFRMKDSVMRLRTLLRRRWGLTFHPSSKPDQNKRIENYESSSNSSSGGSSSSSGELGLFFPTATATSNCLSGTAATLKARTNAGADKDRARGTWSGKARWSFNVDHRHGIFEGNTLLNFAVRCGRRKCVEFILWQMGADTEIADYGGFTPLLNTAWRGDAPLLKTLLAAGARLDVKGVSRGVGPFSPLEWAERKNRPVTAAFLRSLEAREEEGGSAEGAGPGRGNNGKSKVKAPKEPTHSDVRVGAP
ncbi:conserved unknown protein [Ectocarpus siliculosus]|uniref:Uncharacterized protein n=1 Tax=Ectocarpus siliculosus TaxID=2880 RepID=D7FJ95_ECTSI|nr:conserved unknown protein [Ectocarpus siliculosus]|eukprot:CBJ29001.1 conserved unknown protein [Ectocarpus siliculosus]